MFKTKKSEGLFMLCLMLILLATIGYNERTEKENQIAKAKTESENANKKTLVNGKHPVTRPLASFEKLSQNSEGQ